MKRLKDSRSITYSFATPADKDQIRRLVSGCGLPTLYIHRHLKFFIVAKVAQKIIGVIGLEPHGRVGLLRSLCVDPTYRGRGVAKKLNASIMAHAHRRGIDRLYMFTFNAAEFATKLGFHKIAKSRLPESIRSTWQFQKLKPYPVVCMTRKTGP